MNRPAPNDSPAPRAVPTGHDTATTGLDERPQPLNSEQVLDRVQTEGAFAVFRDTLPVAERAAWDAALRRGAGARGLRVTIRDMGGVVLISDGAHNEQVGQIERALFEVVADTTAGAVTAQDPDQNQRSHRAHLRLVRDSA